MGEGPPLATCWALAYLLGRLAEAAQLPAAPPAVAGEWLAANPQFTAADKGQANMQAAEGRQKGGGGGARALRALLRPLAAARCQPPVPLFCLQDDEHKLPVPSQRQHHPAVGGAPGRRQVHPRGELRCRCRCRCRWPCLWPAGASGSALCRTQAAHCPRLWMCHRPTPLPHVCVCARMCVCAMARTPSPSCARARVPGGRDAAGRLPRAGGGAEAGAGHPIQHRCGRPTHGRSCCGGGGAVPVAPWRSCSSKPAACCYVHERGVRQGDPPHLPVGAPCATIHPQL